MGRFFITGSSDGLGAMTARQLISLGHSVVLHARNEQRAVDAKAGCPGAEAVLVADLSSIEETKALAEQANAHGPFDGVLHNAGVFLGMDKVPGQSGLPTLFTVNTLAPYILTSLMNRPRRLVFVSSSMHYRCASGLELDDQAKLLASGYSETKLHNVLLANAFARRWPDVQSNSADPGWVPTKMGGAGATQKAEDGVDTFVLLMLGEGAAAGKTGTYWVDSTEKVPHADALDSAQQDKLLGLLAKIGAVPFPSS